MMRDWGVCKDCALKENCAGYKPNKLQCEDYEQYKEVLTNEEWFCALPTKEKAKFLAAQQLHGGTIASRSDVDWEVWLMEKHNGARLYEYRNID